MKLLMVSSDNMAGSRFSDRTAAWFPSAQAGDLCPDWFGAHPGARVFAPLHRFSWFRLFAEWSKHIAAAVHKAAEIPLIGISGSQGSGKSTLSKILATALEHEGYPTVVLSLDDYYLPRVDRQQLGRSVHPMLVERGMPGTHDLALLHEVLDRLLAADLPIALPRFDKGIDDRLPETDWCRQAQSPRVILLEGWCVGCPPRAAAEPRTPYNRREAEEDPSGIWRGYVDEQLRGNYRELWRRLDALHFLSAPSFSTVGAWRNLQEQANRDRQAPLALNTEQVSHYVLSFERLTLRMIEQLPPAADLIFELREDHLLKRVLVSDQSSVTECGDI